MKRIFYPILFALYPILSLYSYNINEMSFTETLLPSAIMISATSLIWFLLSLLIKNKYNAGLITSLFLFFLFTYGRIWDYLYDIFNKNHWQESIFFIIWWLLFLLFSFIINHTKKRIKQATYYLNTVSIILIILPIIMIFFNIAFTPKEKISNQFKNTNVTKKGEYPDIYYIILDGCGRTDVLKHFYNYDDSNFINFLKKKGFYIADKSIPNYTQTALSLSSSLNMKYLNEIAKKMGEKSYNRKPLRNMIRYNKVSKILKQFGYKFISFATGIAVTEIPNADIYLSPSWSFTEFQNILLNTTPFPFIWGLFSKKTQYDIHRERILYILNNIAKTHNTGGPKFVFAHIIGPHPPFVFGKNGESVNAKRKFSFADGGFIMKRESYVTNYRNQLIFIFSQIKNVVNQLLSNPNKKPIIIIQGDHGPGSILNWRHFNKDIIWERMSMLNVYYFPDKEKYKYLYKTISPVNSFRIIFNNWFGLNFKLLPDKRYFSSWQQPYKFYDVTDW